MTGLIFRDSDTLISGGEYGTVKVWDVATVTIRHEFKAAQQSIAALALTPDGSLLATAGSDEKKVRLWEMPAAREIASFDTEAIYSGTWPLAFTPDGKSLAAGGHENGVIQIWDLATHRQRKLPVGRELANGNRLSRLLTLTFSPDGQTIFAPDRSRVIHCLDVNSGRDRFARDEPAGPVGDASFTADGRSVLTGSFDEYVRTYDLAGRQIKRQPAGYVTVFSPKGRVAFTSSSNEWWLMDPVTGRSWGRTRTDLYALLAAAFAPNGQTVAVLTSPPNKGNVLQLHDTATGQLLRTFEDAAFGVVLKFTPDGKSLALVERKDGDTIHFWDAATGRTTGRIVVPPACHCRQLDFSPDGLLVAVPRIEPRPADQMGRGWPPMPASVAILEVANGRERQRLRLEPTERSNEIWSVRFTADGRCVYLGMEDGTVRLLELASTRERSRFATKAGSVTALEFSPDGGLLSTANGVSMREGGSGDGTVYLWPLRATGPSVASDRVGREALWSQLGSPDAAAAGRVINRLVADPASALAVIQEGLSAAAPATEYLRQLIAELDSTKFEVRTKAFAELERLSDRARNALRLALAAKPSNEVRLQVERLLSKLESSGEPPERLRVIRTVEVLETIDTADARRLLAEFANGDPAARLTREAQGSLQRLNARSSMR